MIKGKVARILSENEVVLNIGVIDGVKPEMEFVIYSESDHIYDPSTGNDLGAIEIAKGRVIVTHVMEKMSRAETRTYEVSPSDEFHKYAILGIETRKYKLQVEQTQLKPLRDKGDLTVKVGDLVHSV